VHSNNGLQNTCDCPLFNDVVLNLQSIQIAVYFQYTVIICLQERWISQSFKTAVPNAEEATIACNSRELGGKHTPVPLSNCKVGFMVHKVTVRQAFLRLLTFSTTIFIPPIFSRFRKIVKSDY